MTATPSQHGWSADALFSKAVNYAAEMERCRPDDWRFRLWASLSLELLARAALARISPTLLAQPRGEAWRNVYHALGFEPTKKGFTPKSISTTEVLKILREVIPSITKELYDSCVEQCWFRNAELHTGEDTFTGCGTSGWLPQFYASCQVLLRSLGKGLDELFGDVKSAERMIAALQDTAAESVRKDIYEHKGAWAEKTPQQREIAMEQARVWATRQMGHRANCPSCDSPAIIHGSEHGSVSTEIGEDMVVQKQPMLPSSFECIACGLRISGFSETVGLRSRRRVCFDNAFLAG